MTTLLELLFQNKLNILSAFQKYDEEGYLIEEENEYDDLEEDDQLDDDDDFDSSDEINDELD